MKRHNLLIGIAAIAAILTLAQCSTNVSDSGKNLAVVAKATTANVNQDRSQPVTSFNDEIANIETGPARIREGQQPVRLQSYSNIK